MRARRDPHADGRLAGPHHARRARGARVTVGRSSQARRGRPSALRTSSATESPPNLRCASAASTSATIVSATTPMAGTAVTSVRSLKLTVSSLVATSTVLQRRPVQRGQRLHGRPDHEQLAGGHAALDAAGQRRLAAVAAVGAGVPDDRVVGLAAPPAGHLEAVADLDALHGLDAHERLGQQARRACGPSGRGCRARRARRRPAPRRCRPSESPSLAAALISAIIASSAAASKQRTGDSSTASQVGRRRAGRSLLDAGRAHLDDVAQDVDAELGQQRLGQRSRPRPGPRSRGRWPARARRGRRRSRTSACRRGRRGRAAAG